MDSDNTVQKSTTKIQTQNIVAIVGIGLVGWETISTVLQLDTSPSIIINNGANISKKVFRKIGSSINNLTMASIDLILSPLSFLDSFLGRILYY